MVTPINLKTTLGGLTRRDFIQLSTLTAAGLLTGCAANPVTGKSQLMLVSEDQEIQIDKKNSPYQFSADYGTVRDPLLAGYMERTGKRVAAQTHRPHMPYEFKVVNATYVNAYAFPGGSIAATRGILLTIENEAELAALLGHELGHVNARHTAEQMSKGQITQGVIGGLAAIVGTQGQIYGQLASQLGAIGAGALLASYSRENEHEADKLGLEYMVKAGYGSKGFIDLMDMLNNLNKHKTSTLQLLFSTHPMSSERYRIAVARVQDEYGYAADKPLHRERYMDHTANLRKIAPAIKKLQTGERAMAKKQYQQAEKEYAQALKLAPQDYAGLVMMAKCQLVQNKHAEAQRYADRAKKAYPEEAQGYHLAGYAKIKAKKFSAALADFNRYDKLLPGNPGILFLKGVSYEGMQKKEPAARQYYQYLKAVRQGDNAKYAYKRLVDWGYIK
ncbi:MAG: M48 family metalloprotease [Desulfobacterales bacterium]|nr:M48 family metalloprotease [Desulfobacterales bacterium]